MEELKKIKYPGKFCEAIVPDTLDLAERAKLAINGLGGTIDSHYNMYFYVNYCSKKPYMSHHAADTTCDAKYMESFPMMRIMCGSDQYADIEAGQRADLVSRIQDGLYWNFVDPARPWRSSYNPEYDGIKKDEDVASLTGVGRMLRALLTCREVDGDPIWDKYIRELVSGMKKIAVYKNDYSYYPDGGFGEPFSYPRSGWLRTDEAKSETEGGEGSVVCGQGHQIQALARWYAMSGDDSALDLAGRLTRYCMLPKFWGGIPDPDKSNRKVAHNFPNRLPDPACVAGSEQGHWYTHGHARAIALRGMLEYAMAANDWRVIEFIRRAYEYTLTLGIPRTGWISCYPTMSNHMEGCFLGDMVAFGIRLSDAGIGDYWDDVDAIVRNQLVEGQLINARLLENVASIFTEKGKSVCEGQSPGIPYPNQEVDENVIERTLGNFAAQSTPTSIPKPWVMQCCTGNGTQGLYYAWEAIVRQNGDTAQVNLLLNRASKHLDIDSYLPYEGKVSIHNKDLRSISVRIPSWIAKKEIRSNINGIQCPGRWVGRYLVFDSLIPRDKVNIEFPIKETVSKYTAVSGTDDEQTYTCTFRGSTLVDISPRDESPSSYVLYQRDHMRKDKTPFKKTARFVSEKLITMW